MAVHLSSGLLGQLDVPALAGNLLAKTVAFSQDKYCDMRPTMLTNTAATLVFNALLKRKCKTGWFLAATIDQSLQTLEDRKKMNHSTGC